MAEFSLQLNDDQLELQRWVHEFADSVVRPAGEEWDEREETPWPIIQEAAKIGLYGMDFRANAMMGDTTGLTLPVTMEELFWGDAGIALSIFGSGLAAAGDAGGGQAGAEDRQRDASVAPEQLLHRHREGEAGGVAHHGVGHEVHPVEADLGGLLDDRPRGLLALVPLLAGGPDDGVGELVDPVAQLLLVVGQLEGELSHG